MSIENLQVINLADNINAAIDKINENFDLAKAEITNIYNGGANTIDSADIVSILQNINTTNIFGLDSQGISLIVQSVVDSNYVLNRVELDLAASLVDSATLLQLVAQANSGLLVEVSNLDSNYLALAQQYTNLSSTLGTVDGRVTANANAVSTLTTRVSLNSDGLVSLASRTDQLEAAVIDQITIDSDLVVSAIGGALQDLSTTAYANSDKIGVLSNFYTQLDARLTQLDLDLGTLDSANATAFEELTSRVDATDSNLTAVATKVTNLSADISSMTLDSNFVTTAIATADEAMRAYVQLQDSGVLVAVTEQTSTLKAQIDSDISLATTILRAEIDANGSATSIWGVEMENNQYITGVTLTGTSTRSEFAVKADNFSLVPSASSGGRMEMSNSTFYIYDTNSQLRVKLGFLG